MQHIYLILKYYNSIVYMGVCSDWTDIHLRVKTLYKIENNKKVEYAGSPCKFYFISSRQMDLLTYPR